MHKFKYITTKCTLNEKPVRYEKGDLICARNRLKVNSNEFLEIKFIVKNKDAEDPYERGYQELHRYKNNKLSEKIRLLNKNDAYWSQTPFVRIRKMKFLEDIDGDGFLEFSIFPFHPGSAIWGTTNIYTLRKNEIKYWGKGRYQFEGDSYVKINCPDCSKFNPKACQKCS